MKRKYENFYTLRNAKSGNWQIQEFQYYAP